MEQSTSPYVAEFAKRAQWLGSRDGTVEELLAWVALHQRQRDRPTGAAGPDALLDELRTVLELCVCDAISEAQCRQRVSRLAERTV